MAFESISKEKANIDIFGFSQGCHVGLAMHTPGAFLMSMHPSRANISILNERYRSVAAFDGPCQHNQLTIQWQTHLALQRAQHSLFSGLYKFQKRLLATASHFIFTIFASPPLPWSPLYSLCFFSLVSNDERFRFVFPYSAQHR